MKAMRLSVFLITLTGALTGYGQREIPKDLKITLERSQCAFGQCPNYSLTIVADGLVEFTPRGKPVFRGDGEGPSPPLKGSVSSDKLGVLLAEFENIRFNSLQRRYGSKGGSNKGRSCPVNASDNPAADISIVMNGKHKTVSHYLGCRGAKILDDLRALENRIDEIADSKQWTSQYGWGAASVIDLRLQINPANSSKPEKQP